MKSQEPDSFVPPNTIPKPKRRKRKPKPEQPQPKKGK